jgi:hypothetical protein
LDRSAAHLRASIFLRIDNSAFVAKKAPVDAGAFVFRREQIGALTVNL